MFQFDEEWDPEEEQRDQEEYRRINERAQKQQQQKQQKIKEKDQQGSSNLYEDYFAIDPAQLMPSSGPSAAAQSQTNSNSNNNRHHPNANHPNDQALRFIEHPQSEWIVRSNPAQISCTAVNARRIRVKCNAKWLDENRIRLEEGLDPTSGHPTLRANADVQRAELDAWLADLGEFACQCWAYNGKAEAEDEEEADEEDSEDDADEEDEAMGGPSTSKEATGKLETRRTNAAVIRSETARIRLAYLRKHFHQVPIGQRVHEGRTIQLQCQPPDGDPKAEVYWHRNGHQLHFPASVDDAKSVNQHLIQAGDGSLILTAVRLSDSGNYSCEARNPANRRFTDAAEIGVYVDGDWSPWSEWEGDCANVLLDCPVLHSQLAMVRGDVDAVQRVLPRQRRIRACNNPAPLNGGNPCQGPEEEFRECGHQCRLDGAWTQWAQWGTQCDQQCRRERRRECAAPAPANGGSDCPGPAQQWRNCSGSPQERLPVPDHCLPPNALGHSTSASSASSPLLTHSSSPAAGRPLFDSQLLALASLGCVAFLLLIIALLAGLLICARKKRAKGGHSGASVAHCGAGIFLDREEKLYFPGAAVAATTEDEMGNVRTVLLDQKMLLDSLGPSPAHYGGTQSNGTPGTNGLLPRFFSLKPGSANNLNGTPLIHPVGNNGGCLHPTVSTPAASSARLAAFLHSPNSYTLRSWSSRNGRTDGGCGGGGGDDVVQPYASGPIRPIGAGGGRTPKHHQQRQQQQDVAGSRAALLPEYSSSSQGSNQTAAGHSTGRRCSSNRRGGRAAAAAVTVACPMPPDEEENNYATLYEGLARQRTTAESIESIGADSSSGPDYAFSRGSSSAGTQPIGGGGRPEDANANGGSPTFVAVQLDQEPTRIELRQSGAALTIGDSVGTFQQHCATVFLSVSDDATNRPELAEGETWLSSSVAFGLCDDGQEGGGGGGHIWLNRPVILSVEHCASLFPKEHCWLFSVWAQLDQSGQWTKAWEDAAGGNGQNAEEFGLHIDRERWHLMTRRMGRFILVGRQRKAHVAAQKRVHLSAYWTPPSPASICHRPSRIVPSNGCHHPPPPPPPPRPDRPCYDPVPIGTLELAQIRVYCVPETAMAVESVRQQERRRMGGQVLAEAGHFLLQTRGPLCCCLEQIGFPGGEAHPTGGSQYLEIPEQLHRWCAQNGLHFQLNVSGMPSSPNNPTLPRSMKGRLVLYQKGNATERQLLSFFVDADNPASAIGREDSELSQLSAFDEGRGGGDRGEMMAFSQFQLSPQVRAQLAQLLEDDSFGAESAGNWQQLAEKMALERHIPFLLCQSSPALSLLELWEALHAGSDRALLDLLQTLRVLGRPDAVHLLELFLADQPPPPNSCPPVPFCSLNPSPEESRQELAAVAASASGRLHRAISE